MSQSFRRPNLTDEQAAALAQAEQDSFALHCLRLGYDPAIHQSEVLRRLQDAAERRIEEIGDCVKDPAGSHFLKERLRELEAEARHCKDLWSYRRLWERQTVGDAAVEIVQRSESLSIHWRYLERVATRFGLPIPSPSAPTKLADFITAVPCLFLFGHECNASVAERRWAHGLPVVCIDELLRVASQGFLDVVMKQVFVSTETLSAEVVKPSAWSTIGSDPSFMKECSTAIDLALGRRDVAFHDPGMLLSRSWPSSQLSCSVMFSGATTFARLHEYGHLLMGHLDMAHDPQLELDADRFAMTVLAGTYAKQRPDVVAWYELGAIGLLVMFAIFEAIDCGSPSRTHPPAMQRLYCVTAGRDKGVGWEFDVALTMLGVCQRTVEQTYGGTLSLPAE